MFTFFSKHKLVTAVLTAVILAALWYFFRPEKLFITQRVNEAAPQTNGPAPQLAYTGKLKTQLHETSGRASVYRQSDGSLLLRLTDFKTSNGPDVHVFLTTPADPGLLSKTPGTALQGVEVAALKGNEGDQSYPLPAGADLSHFPIVTIYCERFHAVFGSAHLEPF